MGEPAGTQGSASGLVALPSRGCRALLLCRTQAALVEGAEVSSNISIFRKGAVGMPMRVPRISPCLMVRMTPGPDMPSNSVAYAT